MATCATQYYIPPNYLLTENCRLITVALSLHLLGVQIVNEPAEEHGLFVNRLDVLALLSVEGVFGVGQQEFRGVDAQAQWTNHVVPPLIPRGFITRRQFVIETFGQRERVIHRFDKLLVFLVSCLTHRRPDTFK